MSGEVRRTKRELVYEGAILKVYQDTMEFANGNSARWDYIHHVGAAAVVPVLEDGRILMVRQYRNALERDTLEIPAGKLDAPGSRESSAAEGSWRKRPATGRERSTGSSRYALR